MTTQYTTILKLALPVQGELSGTWGDVVNDNITQMVEQAVAGKAVINTWTGNSHTLTTADGTTSESRCAILELTDSGTALTGAGTVVCPTNTKLYIVDNNTAQIITVKTSGGTGIAVPVGKTMLVYCDGTNVVEGVTHANSLSLGTSTVTADKILDEDNMASDSATAIATQQSIKAYVDSQVGSFDTLAEVLAQGNTTGGTDLAVSTGDDITFADSSKAIFGAGSDLQIYHDGSNSYIDDAGTGNLLIRGSAITRIQSYLGEDMIVAVTNGAANLYYDAAKKLATTASGIDVTGDITLGDTNPTITFEDSSITNLSHTVSSASDNLRLAVDVNGVDAGSRVEIFDGSTEVARFSAGAMDVTGTVTADGLTVDVTDKIDFGGGAGEYASSPIAGVVGFTSRGSVALFTDSNNNGSLTGSAFTIYDGAEYGGATKTLLDITKGNDISFYEDTGTTPKFFWDASAESLGINNASPIAALDVTGTDAVGTLTSLADTVTRAATIIRGSTHANGYGLYMGYGNSSTDAQYIQSTLKTGSQAYPLLLNPYGGNVGIGTDSPSEELTIRSSVPKIQIEDSDGTNQYGQFYHSAGITAILARNDTSDGTIVFQKYDGTTTDETMRISSAGLVGIGTSSPDTLLHLSGDATAIIRLENTNAGLSLNSVIGGIEFEKQDASGAGVGVAGSVTLISSSSNGAETALTFGTSSTARGNNDEAMRIDGDGNVGIGTDSPAATTKLHISGAGTQYMRVENTTTGVTTDFGTTSTGSTIINRSATPMMFFTDSTERMRIDSSGNVGIGTAAPASMVGGTADTAILTVGGGDGSLVTGDRVGAISFKSDDATYKNQFADGIVGEITSIVESSSGSTYGLAFSTGNAATVDRGERMRIDASGNVRIGVGSSTAITGLTQTNLIVGSGTGGEIVAYRDDNAGVEGDFVGAFLFGNDDNSGAEDHFAGMYGKIVGTAGNSMSLNFASGLGNYENDTPQMVLDASGNLGIGTASPKTTLNVAANNSGQGAILTLENTDTGITTNDVIGQIDFYANDGSTNGTGAKVNIKAIAASGAGSVTALTFGTSDSTSATAVEAMRIDASGHAIIPAGVTLGTATGVYAAANTLDDYEEGAWVPTVNGDATGVIYTGATGSYYTKVGNLVTIYGAFRVTTNFTSNFIGGLPFQIDFPNSASSYLSGGIVMGGGTNSVCISLGNTSSTMRFHTNQDVADTHLPNTTVEYYRFQFSYRTNS